MNGKNDIDWGGWLLTVIMLGVFWPVGLVLLFRQLTGYSGSRRTKTVKRHPYDEAREQQAQRSGTAAGYTQNVQNTAGQGTTIRAQYQQTQWNTQQQARRTQSAASQQGGWDAVKKTSAKAKKKDTEPGRALIITGSIIAAIFGLAICTTIGEWWGYWRYMFQDLFPMLGFFGGGLLCIYTGRKQRKKARRHKKYLSYIGKNQEVSVSALASAMGVKEKEVYEDLQEMLDNGVLPMGYLDVAAGMLILSDEGITQRAAPQPAPEPEPVKKTVEDENAILKEIKEVNDAIPDEAMSAKIDRIGEITGKILDYQRSHPSKSGQLRSFLNYYLPTTLKILRAYAQLDAQGIEGENITAAKKRIEDMMDQVVDGFEKQLDKLFADDALDITSDVQVLENMLRKDGLADDGMLFTGAPAAQSEGAFSPQQAYLDLQKVADELDAQKKDKDDGQITLQL